MRAARRAASFVLLLACGGCARGCGGEHVAQVELVTRQVDRDRGDAVGRWENAAVGAQLAMGDGLRTGVDARCELSLQPEGHLLVQPSTTLRFERQAPGKARAIELETGAVEIESANAPVVLTTAAGVARMERGAKLRVRRERGATQIDVAVGKVRLERDGQSRELSAGEQYELVVGRALLEPVPQVAPTAAPAAVVEAAAPPVELAPEALRFEPGPSTVELSAAAGDSFTVHDPSPPTSLELTSVACGGELALETSRDGFVSVDHRVRGRGRVALALPAGRHRYRVRCFEQGGHLAERVAALGVLIVVRDAGERRLPERAPAATVDADGRRYTVRYQNILPVLTLRWPSAPAAARYVLELRPEHGPARTRMLTEPRATLPGGELGEGTHGFRFTAGAARSPEGSLRIAFDNAARIAYLSDPRDRSFAAGTTVRLRGAALAQATVDLPGAPQPVPVPTDPQGRFDLRTTVSAQAYALALRVHYPGSGVHYFLRRVAGARP